MFAAGKTARGSAATTPVYIEDVMSTFLYTGNGSTQTITNGIDLSGKGGMVWVKSRSNTSNHIIDDTVNGPNWQIYPNLTNNAGGNTNRITAFNSTGFNLGYVATDTSVNESGYTYTSWTFRKQAKFFDIVTYTGTGSVQNIAHSLGSTPGCIIVKQTSGAANWAVYHTSLGNTKYLLLNGTGASTTSSLYWDNTDPTSTQFTVGTSGSTNLSGATYVAYLFAHNAGGFGLTGTDNVISCGSFTTDGSGNASVTLGYEPQWVLTKRSSGVSQWLMVDTMRGNPAIPQPSQYLCANLSNAEAATGAGVAQPTSTGFNGSSFDVGTHIYIAIRRGPMKVPTDATKVFAPIAATGSTGTSRTLGFVADMTIGKTRAITDPSTVEDRLRGFANTNAIGAAPQLVTTSTSAEITTQYPESYAYTNTNRLDGQYANGASNVWWNFGRAPSFFDEVCYTGTGTAGRTINHNLGVAPELMIVKTRSGTLASTYWGVYSATLGPTKYLVLQQDASENTSSGYWNNTAPTSSVFTVGNNGVTNYDSASTYVAYLFATCAGVSKVGSYTGNGTTQTINCGFTGGARFVLIKRTDSTGDWYVYDTARGMTTLTDPYLRLNSTAAETATLGSVTTVSTGFAVNASILAAINTSGASYIYLSIA